MKKRIISLLLCALLIIGVMPITAFATSNAYLDGRTLYITDNDFTTSLGNFATTDYDKIVFTEDVTSVDYTGFNDNTHITSLVFEGDVEICENAFEWSTSLTDVIFKGECIVGKEAFLNCQHLRRLIFNKKATVGECAFMYCGIAQDTSMLPLYVPAESTFALNSMRESGFTEVIVMGTLVDIGISAFHGNEKLTSVTTYYDEVTIESTAFYECTALTKADFGGSVRLCDFAFGNDTNLKEVNFDYSVKIGCGALYGTAVEELTIREYSSIDTVDDTVEGDGAFQGMTKLKKITFEAQSPMAMHNGTFYNASPDLKIIVPRGSVQAYKDALALGSLNHLYVNNVVEDENSSYVGITVNDTNAGTITTNLGECYPDACANLNIGEGTPYTHGYFETGETLQINFEPKPGYTACVVNLDDSSYYYGTQNELCIKITEDTSLEVIFEAHSEEEHCCYWENNAYSHWKYCDNCDSIINIDYHNFNDNGVCEDCGYTDSERTEYLNSLADNIIDTQNYTGIGLWVGSTSVTRDNYQDILGDGTVSYDLSTATLSLNSTYLSDFAAVTSGAGIISIVSNLDDLTINISGQCTLDAEEYSGYDTFGIYSTGKLTINGVTDDAELIIKPASGVEASCGILTNGLTINEVDIKCDVPCIGLECKGLYSSSTIDITDSDIELETNNKIYALAMEYSSESVQSGLDETKYQYNAIESAGNISITGSDVSIGYSDGATYGFYNGITCSGYKVTLTSSNVTISTDNYGIYSDKLALTTMKSLCLYSKMNFDKSCSISRKTADNYIFMTSPHNDKNNWSIVDADSGFSAGYDCNLMVYMASDLLPEDGYSPVLGNTTFSLDKNKVVMDCIERLKLTATFNSENYGVIDGLTYDFGTIENGEKTSAIKGTDNTIDSYVAPLEDGKYYVFYCDLYYGDTLIDGVTIDLSVTHNKDYADGRYRGCDNTYHSYNCGCGDAVLYEEIEHSYDHNGVCKVCGYKRVCLSSDDFNIDNVTQNILTHVDSPITYSEDNFTLSDETCFIEILQSGSVIVCRCGQTIAEYVFVDKSVLMSGDIDGDGWVNGQDAVIAVCLKNGLLTEDDIGYIAYKNADFNNDGTIDDDDIDVMVQAGLLLMSVDTTQSKEFLLETSAEYCEYLALIGQSPIDEPDQPAEKTGIIDYIIDFLSNIFNLFAKIVALLIK